jgi:broad specificity phosphatase PhoE
LRRHAQTLEGILSSGIVLPPPTTLRALNEYDADSLLQALGERSSADSHSVASHFRQLRLALRAWMQAELTPSGMPTFMDFQSGLQDLLHQIQTRHSGKVLVVSSGGPISCLVGSLLGANVDATIAMNFRLRNASISELAYDAKRHHFISFNEVSHLNAHQNPDWVTFV